MSYKLTEKNKQRASRAEGTLNAYKDLLGEGGPIDADTVRDLIQDIMHWRAQDDPDGNARETVMEACRNAYNDFPSEADATREGEADGEPGL